MAEFRLTPAAAKDLEAIWNVERHAIYFRIAPYGIAVVRILHQRMDAPRHL